MVVEPTGAVAPAFDALMAQDTPGVHVIALPRRGQRGGKTPLEV